MSEVSNLFVVVLGVGTVFTGLICIIILCKLVGLFCSAGKGKSEIVPTATPTAQAVAKPIENKQEIIAAVSAAVAEELGTDVSAIRILSFKKI